MLALATLARWLLVCALVPLRARALDGGAVDGACAELRRGNPRVLALFVENMFWGPMMLSGLHQSGFEVGVASYEPDNVTLCRQEAGCVFWRQGSPPLVRFARVLSRKRTSNDIVDAIIDWRPAIVLPDLASAVVLMRKAAIVAKRGESEPEHRAARVLACSLPGKEQLWGVLTEKLRLMKAIERLPGVRVPWAATLQVRLRAGSGRPTCLTAAEASVQPALARLPLVLKTNRDASGRGVHVCRTRAQLDHALATVCTSKGGSKARAEQLVEGHTLEYVGAALDGVVLAGVCYVKFVTSGATGPSSTLRTVNSAQAARYFVEVVRALRFSGVGGIDLRMDAQGRAWVIDPNLRMNAYAGLPGEAFGLPPQGGLAQSLRRALELGSGEAAAAAGIRPEMVSQSTTVSRVRPGISDPVEPWAYCPDVLLAVPWEFADMYNNASVRHAGTYFDARTCEVRFLRDGSDVRVRQRCPLCPQHCLPVQPTSPSWGGGVVHAEQVGAMCLASEDWLRAHRGCVEVGSQVTMQPNAVGPTHQAHVCGKRVVPTRSPASAAMSTSPAGSAADDLLTTVRVGTGAFMWSIIVIAVFVVTIIIAVVVVISGGHRQQQTAPVIDYNYLPLRL